MYDYCSDSVSRVEEKDGHIDFHFNVQNHFGYKHKAKAFISNVKFNNGNYEFTLSQIFVNEEPMEIERTSMFTLAKDINQALLQYKGESNETVSSNTTN